MQPSPPGSLTLKAVVLCFLLVAATVSGTALGLVPLFVHQVEASADQRLQTGARGLQQDIDDARGDLEAAAAWLTRDPDLLASLAGESAGPALRPMGFALRLSPVDEALLVTPQGNVLAAIAAGDSSAPGIRVLREPGFLEARVGRSASGVAPRQPGALDLQVYTPVFSPEGDVLGVLRLSTRLDERLLQRFRDRTGLEASLFLGETRFVTTLRATGNAPLLTTPADPEVFRLVVGEGQVVVAWRDLPTGRFRSHASPLYAADGTRTGILSVSLGAGALVSQLQTGLAPIVPVIVAIVLAGSLLGYFLILRVRQPINALAAAANRLQSGDFATPVPQVRGPELGPLSQELEAARLLMGRSREAASREEQRQRSLFDALGEPIFVTGPDGTVSSANGAAQALFGARNGFVGQHISSLFPFVQPPEDGLSGSWQGRLALEGGRTFDLHVSGATVPAANLPAARVYVVHDVSEQAEVGRLREQLLYSVAHELRAPLAVLRGALEIIASDYQELSSQDFDQLLRSAVRTGGRLEALMEDLLSAGSIQAGRLVVRPAPVPLAQVVDFALELIGPQLDGRQQRVEQLIRPPDLQVLADRRYLRQVFSNLIGNASTYSPAREVVRVSAETMNGRVMVAVRDHGPGIPFDEQEALFERFYRLRPSHDEPGIGLGLAIVKGIVEAHHGTIGIDSAPGEGTTVWFTLPGVAPVESERRRLLP